MREEVWISVDVETSGPTPATGSLLAIGACRVDDPDIGYYVELQPLVDRPWGEAEERVHGLSRDHLERHGLPRREAVGLFATWIGEQVAAAPSAGAPSAGAPSAAARSAGDSPADLSRAHFPAGVSHLPPRPVFVALNAPFDWMWVADAFHAELGTNPFGSSGLDIKALFLGRHWGEVRQWGETSGARIARRLGVETPHRHHALDDARRQAELARRLLGIGGR
jgi:DNA polymerase III epsilon subunit-like protein